MFLCESLLFHFLFLFIIIIIFFLAAETSARQVTGAGLAPEAEPSPGSSLKEPQAALLVTRHKEANAEILGETG